MQKKHPAGSDTDRKVMDSPAEANETNTKSVAVLMSAYNGEAYIQQQIQSILDQKGVNVTLFIRDDGSTDHTPEILGSLAATSENIYIDLGENMGVVSSFLKLLDKAGPDYDFYAFADQDDFWLDDKLSRAVKMIRTEQKQRSGKEEIPHMYYSRLDFVDESLRHLGYSTIPATTGFHNALVQNQATGCTIVLDQTARRFICKDIPDWALMHDWWCYLVCSAFGKVIYDPESRILYRKHDSNVTPATPDFIRELYARTRRFLGENDIPEKVTDQAREFKKRFGHLLTDDKKKLLNGFLEVRKKGLAGRFRYSLTMPVRRNTPVDNFIMRILIVIGRF